MLWQNPVDPNGNRTISISFRGAIGVGASFISLRGANSGMKTEGNASSVAEMVKITHGPDCMAPAEARALAGNVMDVIGIWI